MGKIDATAEEYREHTLSMINELVSYFSDERRKELEDFVYSYNHSRLQEISFALGKDCEGHSIDVNSQFRDDLAYYILSNYSLQISPELLRDIYIESAKSSKDLSGSPEYVAFIAENLIRRTGSTYIREFCLYLTSSFDFYGSCISIDLYEYPVEELIGKIKNLMAEYRDEDEHKKYEHAIEFLQRYI